MRFSGRALNRLNPIPYTKGVRRFRGKKSVSVGFRHWGLGEAGLAKVKRRDSREACRHVQG